MEESNSDKIPQENNESNVESTIYYWEIVLKAFGYRTLFFTGTKKECDKYIDDLARRKKKYGTKIDSVYKEVPTKEQLEKYYKKKEEKALTKQSKNNSDNKTQTT